MAKDWVWPSFKFRDGTNNRKVGNIPVTYSHSDSCPPSCKLGQTNVCYAKGGPTRMIWDRMTKPGTYADMRNSYNSMLFDLSSYIKKANRYWSYVPRIRGNITGDLPSNNKDREHINLRLARRLGESCKGGKVLFYSHYKPSYGSNAAVLAMLNWYEGLTVNLSGDNLDDAVELMGYDCGPVTALLPYDWNKKVGEHKGVKIVTCRYDWDGTQCKWCMLCWNKDRDYIVGFIAHGTSKRKHKNLFYRG